MKIVISIFSLPHEIDDLEKTLNQLKIASNYISNKTEWVLDVSMTLSDELVNWKKSSIPKQYFVDKFMKLSAHTDWCMKTFRISDEIKGCVSQRRFTTLEYTDADFFIWLDPFKDSGIKGDVSLESVSASIRNQPRFKFAGGWMTCLSGDLVRRIGVPESFGHYGYEDTFIMWGAEKLMKSTDINIQQFKIKNLVVCENYKYRNNSHYINNISAFDKREEYKKVAESKFNEELNKLT